MIRAAAINEAETLSQISYASKRYWNYPQEYFQVWEKELLVTREYIKENMVFVGEEQGEVKAYYSVVNVVEDKTKLGVGFAKGYWLDHMFVLPDRIGSGLGRKMFVHLRNWCRNKAIRQVNILAEPYARGFYEKMGCQYEQEYPSTIPERTTPLLILPVTVR